MVERFGQSVRSSSTVFPQNPRGSTYQRHGKPDAWDGLCFLCLQVLRELRVQSDSENEIRCGEEFGIDTRTLWSSRNLHCYICSAIWRELKLPESTDDRFFESTLLTLEYLLHGTPTTDDQEETMELRVNALIATRPGEPLREVFKLFVLHPAESVDVLFEQVVTHSTGSDQSLGCLAVWLSECLTSHGACRHRVLKDRWQPSRLIDTDPGNPNQVKSSPSSERPSDVDYVAISYCWGKEPFKPLADSDVVAFECGICASELPKTLQDAVFITRNLGIRYLWVDYLCISQRELNENDWLHEAALIERVYENSILTLAASSVPSNDAGLFSNRSPAELNPPVIALDKPNFMNRTYRVVDNAMWTKEVDDAPLTQRAWVHQERLLSKRTVYFGETQLLWECHSQDATEVLPRGLLSGRNAMKYALKDLDPVSFVNSQYEPQNKPDLVLWPLLLWSFVVERYSEVQWTYPRDKLVALSWFASKYAKTIKSDYVGGLWRTGFEYQLLWQAARPATSSRSETAPSWSWASVRGAICQPRAWNRSALIAEMEDVKVLTTPENPFGMVFGGYLKMKGILREISLAEPLSGHTSTLTWITAVEGRALGAAGHRGPNDLEIEDEVQLDSVLVDLDRYFLFPIYFDEIKQELRGLILTASLGQRTYKRIGSAWVWDSTKIFELLGTREEYMVDRPQSILIV